MPSMQYAEEKEHDVRSLRPACHTHLLTCDYYMCAVGVPSYVTMEGAASERSGTITCRSIHTVSPPRSKLGHKLKDSNQGHLGINSDHASTRDAGRIREPTAVFFLLLPLGSWSNFNLCFILLIYLILLNCFTHSL